MFITSIFYDISIINPIKKLVKLLSINIIKNLINFQFFIVDYNILFTYVEFEGYLIISDLDIKPLFI